MCIMNIYNKTQKHRKYSDCSCSQFYCFKNTNVKTFGFEAIFIDKYLYIKQIMLMIVLIMDNRVPRGKKKI